MVVGNQQLRASHRGAGGHYRGAVCVRWTVDAGLAVWDYAQRADLRAGDDHEGCHGVSHHRGALAAEMVVVQ